MKPVPACLASLTLLAACGSGAGPANMANPASVYCAEQGGRLEIRQEEAGEAGYCILPDGTVVEEWQLYRGKSTL